jgi:hypothetical protein
VGWEGLLGLMATHAASGRQIPISRSGYARLRELMHT